MDLPRGMKDFENIEMQKIEYIREKFLSTSKIFGFELMEPSPIELMSVIEAKSGPTIRDDVYFFNDKGGWLLGFLGIFVYTFTIFRFFQIKSGVIFVAINLLIGI